jgi:hypothetical protein
VTKRRSCARGGEGFGGEAADGWGPQGKAAAVAPTRAGRGGRGRGGG